ncbi:MAG: pyridoxal-phosphate dependent enzyme, partial [Exilibacterium sp.]
LGIAAHIVMPTNAPATKRAATEGYGADIISYDPATGDRKHIAEAHAADYGYTIVPPYDHPQIVAGQGTAALELCEDVGRLDAVLAPCGGGGLLSGSLIAARALSPHAAVIGAEPLNANDAAESRRKGSIQTLQNTPQTLADGAMTLAVGDITFEYLKQLDEFYEVSEADIAYWCQWLNHLLKVRIEPTGALSMAAVKQWLAKQSDSKTVLVVLSGGNMDGKTAQKLWCTDYLTSTPCLTG